MDLTIVNHAPNLYGAHATTMLVNDFVNGRLVSYGPGVEEVWATLLYPGSSRLEERFQRLVTQSPRVTFFRAKRRIEVRCVCRGVSARSIYSHGHLSRAELSCLTTTVSESLELIRPRIRPGDQFNFPAFLGDAQDALVKCPRALRRWVT